MRQALQDSYDNGKKASDITTYTVWGVSAVVGVAAMVTTPWSIPIVVAASPVVYYVGKAAGFTAGAGVGTITAGVRSAQGAATLVRNNQQRQLEPEPPARELTVFDVDTGGGEIPLVPPPPVVQFSEQAVQPGQPQPTQPNDAPASSGITAQKVKMS